MLGTSAILLAASMVIGQAAQSEPVDQLKDFGWLIGSWEFGYAPPVDIPELGLVKGENVSGRITTSWKLKKNIVVMDWESRAGRTVTLGHEIVAWDADKKQVVHVAFTSDGGCLTGVFKQDGDAWVSDWSRNIPGGKNLTAVVRLQKIDADRYTWQLTNAKLDGKTLPDFPKTEFKRVASSAKGKKK
jgi:hypothetical protein